MKKVIAILIGVSAVVAATVIILLNVNKQQEENVEQKPEEAQQQVEQIIDRRSVTYNGKLHIDGSRLLNSHNEEIQLTGISTHGIQWFGELYTKENVAQLKKDFGINIFRIAMYTDPNASGYVGNPALKEKVFELVEASIEQDIYVIIDWHILSDNNPQTYKQQAIEFFSEMAEKYGNVPNVLFEICNEPNNGTQWDSAIKPYAEEVLAAIRAKAPDTVVIVGTPDWSKDLDSVARAPLSDKNVAYTLHFYAGSHNKTLRDTIDRFREKGYAVFVSECGATDASGDGQLYEEAFMRWVEYMDEKKISWLFWSYSNKAEGSSILEPNYVPDYSTPATISEETTESTKESSVDEFSLDSHLAAAGKLMKKVFARY